MNIKSRRKTFYIVSSCGRFIFLCKVKSSVQTYPHTKFFKTAHDAIVYQDAFIKFVNLACQTKKYIDKINFPLIFN